MADQEHLALLLASVSEWNYRRTQGEFLQPDLSFAALDDKWLRDAYLYSTNLTHATLVNADLYRCNLNGSDLRGANLTNAYLGDAFLKGACFDGANLTGATLSGADMRGASLSGAILVGVNLSGARLAGANLSGANLSDSRLENAVLVNANVDQATFTRCLVYGVAAWNLQGTPSDQSDLRLSSDGDASVVVDDLEIAQFVNLLTNHENLRKVIHSMTQRGVLLLGRFGGGGLEVLRAVADELRKLKYLPLIFDFSRPSDRNYTETVKTLAGLSRFVIVDLSGPSVPQELYATVPHFKIPFIPILEESRRPYAMFPDLLEYDWVLKPIVVFTTIAELRSQLRSRVVAPAEARLERRRALLDELFASPS